MTEQDRQISEIIAEERSRLRNFIRGLVPDPSVNRGKTMLVMDRQ